MAHSPNRCMSFIEWTCIACIPTLLCISKIIFQWSPKLYPFDIDNDATKDLVGKISYQTCINTINEEVNKSFVMFPICILVVTVIISLAAIISFGDVQENNNDNTIKQQNKRGVGVVVGSHLVPLLYMAMILYTFDHNIYCSQDMVAEDYVQQQYNPYAGRGLHHFEFASLGGLSFAISTLWMKISQYNHRKFIGKRRIVNGTIGKHINGVKKDENLKTLYTATSMSICWKTYCALIICQSARGVLTSDYDLCTPLLGVIHILLIIIYEQKTINITTQSKAQNIMIKEDGACWQDALTPGEWMVVSTFITSLIGEYILEYSGLQELRCNSKENVTPSYFNSRLSIHLVVAHAGLVGCLVGVTLCSFVQKAFVSAGHDAKSSISVTSLVATVTTITIGSLEVALKESMDISSKYCGIESTMQCTNDTHMLSNGSGDWMILLSLQWIFNFLLSEVDISPFGGPYTINTLRVCVLGYWATVLAVCLPIASILMSWITTSNKKDSNKEKNNIHKHVDKNRNKRVIIARKYFHLVAILLFTPITWLDPIMMSLSYAIAVSLLIVLEMVRGLIVCTANSNVRTPSDWNDMYMTFLDEKDSSAVNGGLAVTHIALIVGCALPLWVTQLLQQTNIPNVEARTHDISPRELFLVLLPFLGILVLGVGDSAGAIGGTNFPSRRHRWPGDSSRTIEGSMCMFLSMMVIVVIFIANTHAVEHHISHFLQVSATMGVLITLIEASTSQIDNLVLPVAGSTLLLLVTSIGE